MESYCQTDVGLKRNNNQDFVYASNHNVGTLAGLLIVADGMGGQAAGDLASRLCVETMVDSIQASSRTGAVRVLSEAIRTANTQRLLPEPPLIPRWTGWAPRWWRPCPRTGA